MMYYTFNAGSKEYKLRLNTRNIVELEKKLGCNPIMVFGPEGDVIPTVAIMVVILHASLQQLQHGVSLNDAYDIFDDYVADGNTSLDFMKVIMEIYRVSGILPKEVSGASEEGKN